MSKNRIQARGRETLIEIKQGVGMVVRTEKTQKRKGVGMARTSLWSFYEKRVGNVVSNRLGKKTKLGGGWGG